MDAVVMCGGRGTRLEAPPEKPLFEVGGRPMVERVRAALAGSRVETVYFAVSPNAPETRARLDGPVVETPGEGYVEDLGVALDEVGTPALTAGADLPLLEGDAVDAVLDAHGSGSLTVCVPAALKRLLGLSVDATLPAEGRDLAPAGINVVGGDGDARHVTYDARLAVNVNRRSDAEVAEALLGDGGPSARQGGSDGS